MKQKIEIDDALIPPGYVVTGEYRCPVPDEPFLSCRGDARTLHFNDLCGLSQPRIILRKIEPAKVSGWMPAYSRVGCYQSLRELRYYYPNADAMKLDFEGDKLVAVSLEPLSKEGA